MYRTTDSVAKGLRFLLSSSTYQRRGKMRVILAIALLSVTVVGCANYKAPMKRNVESTRTYAMPYDEVWNKVVDWFSMNNTPIKNLDKSSGLISTEYNLRNNIAQSCDCGETGFGQRFESAKANFNVVVRQSGDTAVTVRVTTFFDAVLVNPSYQSGVPDYRSTIECHSTGKLEKEILDHVGH